jgi:hypothetical protein
MHNNQWLEVATSANPDSKTGAPCYVEGYGIASDGYVVHVSPSDRGPFPTDAVVEQITKAASHAGLTTTVSGQRLATAIGDNPGLIMLRVPLAENDETPPLELFHQDGRYALIMPSTIKNGKSPFKRPFGITPKTPTQTYPTEAASYTEALKTAIHETTVYCNDGYIYRHVNSNLYHFNFGEPNPPDGCEIVTIIRNGLVQPPPPIPNKEK